MNIFLICLGGSGSKIAEAVVHMAALDLWGQADIHLLMADVDGGNGNHEQARDVAALYDKVHAMNVDPRLFRAGVTLYDWTPGIPQQSLLALQQGSGKKSDLLAKFLYSGQERAMDVRDGFKGHPNIGVLFMQQIMRRRGAEPDDELARFMDAVRRLRPDRIFVAGSCYGGTGASCIPILGKYLRRALGDDIALGLLAVLPSFSLQKDTDDPIDPDSNEFPNRVKTVLSTYIGQDILTYRPQAQGAQALRNLYEKIYLLGSPEPILFKIYAAGNSRQRNPATFFDWFACGAVTDYVQQPEPKAQGVFTAWLEQGTWDWNLFSNAAFPHLQINAAKLMTAVGLYMTELHKSVQGLLRPDNPKEKNMLARYFVNVDAERYRALQDDLNCFAQYSALLQLWFFQIVTTLPPAEKMFHAMGADGHRKQHTPAELEARITALHIQLTEEEEQTLNLLYYQTFFSPPALLRMEKIRQHNWPRGDERNAADLFDDHRFLEAYQAIFTDRLGKDEEKRLGVLLPEIVVGPYYSRATADRLMGMLYARGAYEGSAEHAAQALLARLFTVLDAIGGRISYA